MRADLIETLPLPERLALSYTTRAARDPTLALLALDQRLAAILRGGGEAIIAQIKLAWWRDRLAEAPDKWPEGEPLLALLRNWPGDVARLGPLVDGWEALLDEEFGRRVWTEFSRGRGAAWAALADGVGATASNAPVEQAAREWALMDLALNIGDEAEAAMVREAMAGQAWKKAAIDRRLRPLAVLHALARRAHRRDTAELLDGPGAVALALRVGITGR